MLTSDMEIKNIKYKEESDKKKSDERYEKARAKLNETISEHVCENCGANLSQVGFSTQPGICKRCLSRMIRGEVIDNDE